MRHLHLDPVGGIAGDMFAAALLDAFPEFEAPALAMLAALLGEEIEVAVARQPVGGFAGARLTVLGKGGHSHRYLSDICALLDACDALLPAATEIAKGIFTRLGEAEASVHGSSLEAVHFHEVGAVDSIADIALAGLLIDAVGAESWTVGALPLGGGLVRTEHGVLPVPAPATAHLLEGFEMSDDGVSGERVTPTGAAILNYLKPRMLARRPSLRMMGGGTGFGTRELPDRPNALRVLVMESAVPGSDQVALTSFEIDDQSPEDLAIGLDAVRGLDGVLDVIQAPAFGKKGRMVIAVQVLAKPTVQAAVREAVLGQTSTLGLREQIVTRHVLAREEELRDGIRVKSVRRGESRTAKAEADDIAGHAGNYASRKVLRGKVERDG